jgi:DNA-binding SARP family transcriptional activator
VQGLFHRTGSNTKTQNILIILVVYLLQPFVCNAGVVDSMYNYGLSFYSHSVNQDERTSLELSPNKPFRFPNDGFEMSFDLNLKEELYTYGYVARIVADDISSFDIVSYLLKGKLNFVLTNKDKILENISTEDYTKIVKSKWISIDLQFNKNDIVIKLNNTRLRITHSFHNFQNIKIYFGRNKHPDFYTTDVPPMTIRNIEIKNHKGDILRSWPLMEHRRQETFDKTKGKKAVVENGIWEIDKHIKWAKVASITTHDKNPQMSYDEASGRVFIVSDNKLFIYNVRSNKTDTNSIRKGHHYIGAASQVIYSSKSNNLISYNPELQKISLYNFNENVWSEEYRMMIDANQHHNRTIDKETDQLILFGGYGNHKYNAQLCKIALYEPYNWEIISLDSIIYPRYLSAMGWEDKDNLLIMGGHGSPSGKQEESPRNFYDLYRLNVRSGKIVKVWELDNPESHFVFGNSLVADVKSNNIYALTYSNSRFNTHVCLSKFDLQDTIPSQYIMSDSIKYKFLDIRSFCDLFFDSATSSLYAIIQQLKDTESATVDIYQLVFPPFFAGEIAHTNTNSDSHVWTKFLLILLILLILILTPVFILAKYVRKKKKGSQLKNKGAPSKQNIQAKTPSSISLLGGFQVFNKDGNDMTGDFTPTLQHLFLYIFLYYIKNGKGITSQRLDDTFWFDMEKSKASNNRNVNIRKLRLILSKIGQINISNKGSYWFVEIGKDVTCDYEEVMKDLLLLKSKKATINKINIIRIIDFASAGNLLPNIDAEWIDEYKAEYSSLITEIMLQAIAHPEIKEDSRLLLKIADVILLSDSIDEDAIRVKSKVLYQTGQKGLSKQCYDKFCIEYKRLLNTSPALIYEDIIA